MSPLGPEHLIFMKIGHHANETRGEILARKAREFESSRCIFWGYAGVHCHPIKQVQVLVARVKSPVEVLMQIVGTYVNPAIAPSTRYSVDGHQWQDLPAGVHVLGSQYALVLGRLEEVEYDVDPACYEVAEGPSKGRIGCDYIRRQVSKGCFDRTAVRAERTCTPWRISFKALLQAPYAVLVR